MEFEGVRGKRGVGLKGCAASVGEGLKRRGAGVGEGLKGCGARVVPKGLGQGWAHQEQAEPLL